MQIILVSLSPGGAQVAFESHAILERSIRLSYSSYNIESITRIENKYVISFMEDFPSQELHFDELPVMTLVTHL